jgi:biotin transporter BioY
LHEYVTRVSIWRVASHRNNVITGSIYNHRTAGSEGEMVMNKVIIALMVIYFLGDPSLQYLAWLGALKIYVVAAAITLVSMPWVASQLDG